ncbi:MAG: hypothetical protein AAFY10_00930 [Pseudomonadota bacterium]
MEDRVDGRTTRGDHLTRFGLALDRLWSVGDIKSGQRIVEASAETQDGPVWGGADVKGFVEGSLWALGYGGVSWRSAPDAPPGPWGAAVSFETLTDRGHTYRGMLRARRRGDRLDLVLWIAEESLYAPLTEADAQAMLSGLK